MSSAQFLRLYLVATQNSRDLQEHLKTSTQQAWIDFSENKTARKLIKGSQSLGHHPTPTGTWEQEVTSLMVGVGETSVCLHWSQCIAHNSAARKEKS